MQLKDVSRKLMPYAHKAISNGVSGYLDSSNLDAANVCEAIEKALIHR
jgi:hypothetical protein